MEIRRADWGSVLLKIENEQEPRLEIEKYIQDGGFLRAAYFERMHLKGINLQGVELTNSRFISCNLDDADLSHCKLLLTFMRSCSFREANLSGALLWRAHLNGVNLNRSNLDGADFHQAIMKNVEIDGATLPKFQLPQNETLIGWKKIVGHNRYHELICKLKVPKEARRTASLVGNKCRADFAKVLDIYDPITGERFVTGTSARDACTTYVVGETIYADRFNDNPTIECTGGIHFFLDRKDAEHYILL